MPKYDQQADPNQSVRVMILNKSLAVLVRVLQRDAEEKRFLFNPRLFFRIFVNMIMDLSQADYMGDSSGHLLSAFGNAFLVVQPLRVPGFSYAWLELVSHRMYMPKLLLAQNQKGWPLFLRLLVALFRFLEPYLRNTELNPPVLICLWIDI